MALDDSAASRVVAADTADDLAAEELLDLVAVQLSEHRLPARFVERVCNQRR